MPTAHYPITKYRFQVIGGGLSGSFAQIKGLREEMEAVDMRDGTDPLRVVKIPGLRQGGEVTLVRGVYSNAKDLWQWFSDAKALKPGFKRSVQIEVRGRDEAHL